MQNSRILSVQVGLVVGLASTRQFKDRPRIKWNDRSDSSESQPGLNVKFCSNSTATQAYLKEISALIDALQANETYSGILQLEWTNFIGYVKNTDHQELLRTDCRAFMNGLKAAKKADKAAKRERENLSGKIRQRFRQASSNGRIGQDFFSFP